MILNLEGVEALIFDLDGTLIDSMGVWKKIDEDFLLKRNIPIPGGYKDAVAALSFVEAARYTKDYFSLNDSIDAIISEWMDMARHEYANTIPLKPGAAEFLEALRKRGIKLGIATGSSELLYEAVLSRHNIRDYFQAICSTDGGSRGKSFPDVFLRAAGILSAKPEACLVFEDIPEAAQAAGAAGMKLVGVLDRFSCDRWKELEELSIAVIKDYREISIPSSKTTGF
ncbi:MAG: HAD family phosphatase [Treponema sp.]|jgi:HAD superfamily hydrolase (TIGR01509 family)|nr:HAD family phosphatase [Treponema sp.]